MPDPFSERDKAVWDSIASDFASSLGGIFVIGAVVAFMMSPVVRFFDPYNLEIVALLGALGGTSLFLIVRLKRGRVAKLFATAVVIAGVVVFGNAMDDATVAAINNDRRCAAIQHDMLAFPARRQDDAAMMQALGCRPQGSETPRYS